MESLYLTDPDWKEDERYVHVNTCFIDVYYKVYRSISICYINIKKN